MSDPKNNSSVDQTEEVVSFINKAVFDPENGSPPSKSISELSKPLTDQAIGMMVQDLQIFLKGFEQVGLVALARLANNLLTYGSPYHDPSTKKKKKKPQTFNQLQPEDITTLDKGEILRDPDSKAINNIFEMVSEYSERKAEISLLMKMMHHKDLGIEDYLNLKEKMIESNEEPKRNWWQRW